MLARGTRRRRGPTDAHDKKCAWCKHMRGSDHACTWKPRGPQDKFVSAADVSGACSCAHAPAGQLSKALLFADVCSPLSLASAAATINSASNAEQHNFCLPCWLAIFAILRKFEHQCFPLTPANTACMICLHDNAASMSSGLSSASALSIWNSASPDMVLAIARKACACEQCRIFARPRGTLTYGPDFPTKTYFAKHSR